MVIMNEEQHRAGRPARPEVGGEEDRVDRPPARRGRRDEEPLVVEIAWLIIEGARVVWRLGRILARI
jgi:hypothetical protein